MIRNLHKKRMLLRSYVNFFLFFGCFLKDCCFFNRKKELVGKMEQPEYTKTPRGLARQSETPEAKLRRIKLSPPRKAKCIPAAGNRNKLYENSQI